MKHLVIVFAFFLMSSVTVSAQKYFTKTGYISFYSDTPIEKIEGHNKSSSCVLDLATGKMEFGALVKGFQFEKALMQEHFNENYLESNKFPKATFKGQIDNYKDIVPTKNGKVNVKVSGKLTIHGVTKDVITDGVVTVNNGKIDADAQFNVLVADYGITVPSLVKDQIAKSVKVKVDVTLEALK
jgi:hypothetical protein